jgi:hypothetical protein
MEKISIRELVQVIGYLEQIHDPRRTKHGNIRHKLIDSIVIAFTATLCGYEDYQEMEELGRIKLEFFKGFLELPQGIPDESAFGRVFSWIEPGELLSGLQRFMGENKASGRRINIDGKTIHGTAGKGRNAVHIVSAWVSERNVVLGQVKTEEKSNEITASPELLESLDVSGDTITIDAMGCQRDIAAKIREKEADYVLSVKENQPRLYREIKEYFECVCGGGLGAEPAYGRVEEWHREEKP